MKSSKYILSILNIKSKATGFSSMLSYRIKLQASETVSECEIWNGSYIPHSCSSPEGRIFALSFPQFYFFFPHSYCLGTGPEKMAHAAWVFLLLSEAETQSESAISYHAASLWINIYSPLLFWERCLSSLSPRLCLHWSLSMITFVLASALRPAVVLRSLTKSVQAAVTIWYREYHWKVDSDVIYCSMNISSSPWSINVSTCDECVCSWMKIKYKELKTSCVRARARHLFYRIMGLFACVCVRLRQHCINSTFQYVCVCFVHIRKRRDQY